MSLSSIRVAEALKNYLQRLFPGLTVYRSYLGIESADSGAVPTGPRLAVVPESFFIEPSSRGFLSKQTIIRLVLQKDLSASASDETTFAPTSECDALVETLETIAELFTENVVELEESGAKPTAYVPEARPANDVPIFDEPSLAKGRYLGSLQVAVFTKIPRDR